MIHSEGCSCGALLEAGALLEVVLSDSAGGWQRQCLLQGRGRRFRGGMH